MFSVARGLTHQNMDSAWQRVGFIWTKGGSSITLEKALDGLVNGFGFLTEMANLPQRLPCFKGIEFKL
jgi:hypothetical protein